MGKIDLSGQSLPFQPEGWKAEPLEGGGYKYTIPLSHNNLFFCNSGKLAIRSGCAYAPADVLSIGGIELVVISVGRITLEQYPILNPLEPIQLSVVSDRTDIFRDDTFWLIEFECKDVEMFKKLMRFKMVSICPE